MEDFVMGNRIRELRKVYGMSQEELGRRIGVQRAAVNKYEKGSVTNVPIHTIEKIASVFDVSPTYLVGWDITQGNALSVETKALQIISNVYGIELIDIIESYSNVSDVGKSKIQDYATDMWKIYGQEPL